MNRVRPVCLLAHRTLIAQENYACMLKKKDLQRTKPLF